MSRQGTIPLVDVGSCAVDTRCLGLHTSTARHCWRFFRLQVLIHDSDKVALAMRIAFFFACLLATLCGSAGFVPHVAQRRARSGSPQVAATGQLPSARVCASPPGVLRMSGEAADGGGSDGAALAEARIVVKGQSTGGYFRAHARNEAHFNRKLCGALKELGNGQTEIIVEGKTSAIRSFLRWCQKGPGLSQRIEDVSVDWAEYTGIFDGFEVFPDETSTNKAAGVP